MNTLNILFVGGGNMASAMIGGLLAQGISANSLRVVDPSSEARESLSKRFSGLCCYASLTASAMAVDIVLLAVKPQQMCSVATELGAFLSEQLVVSIAAGIRLADLSRWLGGHPKLVRAMPNTPALIRAGVTGLFAPDVVDALARRQVEQLMAAIGTSFWVQNEPLMDAVTAISGSGPAYVFYVMEAMEQGALDFGFDGPSARQMALETVLGAVQLAASSSESFTVLRQRVTSKGGTTEAAINTMEAAAVASGIKQGMRAAEARGSELGRQLATSVTTLVGRS